VSARSFSPTIAIIAQLMKIKKKSHTSVAVADILRHVTDPHVGERLSRNTSLSDWISHLSIDERSRVLRPSLLNRRCSSADVTRCRRSERREVAREVSQPPGARDHGEADARFFVDSSTVVAALLALTIVRTPVTILAGSNGFRRESSGSAEIDRWPATALQLLCDPAPRAGRCKRIVMDQRRNNLRRAEHRAHLSQRKAFARESVIE